jgi:hypothetical protein
MSSRRLTSVLLLIGTLASCATVAPPEYAIDHPANPGAAIAPSIAPAETLSTYRAAGEQAPRAGALPPEPRDRRGGVHEHP